MNSNTDRSTDEAAKERGITVLGDYLVSEGVAPIVERLVEARVTATACNPTVTAASTENHGTFQPPIDAGSSPRLFDRPLFGQHALWVRSGVSYRPQSDLYADSPYGPRKPNDLTDQFGHIIAEFIDACHQAGIKVYFQLGAVQPSGLRDEDRPCLPDGTLVPDRLADTACLASPAVRTYNGSYLRDLIAAYPAIDGFRIDWPEYPCYTWGEIFQDFSPHVSTYAQQHGFDFEALRQDVADAKQHLEQKLTPESLEHWGLNPWNQTLWSWVNTSLPGVWEWLRLKAHLSNDLIACWRSQLDDAGGADKQLIAHAFMPPFATLTGFDFSAAARLADCISPKLYTMHWSLMLEYWGQGLLESNPLEERRLVACLQQWMQLQHVDVSEPLIGDFGYPAPDEAHPVSNACQATRITQVCQMAAHHGSSGESTARVVPLVHGYGPLTDFERRLRLVSESESDGFWINRYGYLSDEKLTIVRATAGDV